MKRIISILLVLTLTHALWPTHTANAAVKISKTKATLEVDATLTLKITGTEDKVAWSTSNKNIASVDGNGTVTAKKEGQAAITATVNGKNFTCDIKVVDSNKRSFNEELGAGEYLVGEDIPAGTYNIECVNGAGSIEIYASVKDYENDTYDYKLITMAAKDSVDYSLFPNLYTPTYKNLKLKKGNYIVIDRAVISFKSK